MSTIDQSKWSFSIGGSGHLPEALRTTPARQLQFATAFELLRHMADDEQDDYVPIQRCIDERLKLDSVAKAWARQRSLLKDLKHFPKYRRNEYDLYHAAARALAKGWADEWQTQLVSGLDAEIRASRVRVPAGQLLYHGRSNRDLTTQQPYPTFLSTSLNPVVAHQSAFRRSFKDGKPLVYLLTLQLELSALWGQAGNSVEWELLLPRNLEVTETSAYQGANFEVIAADITA